MTQEAKNIHNALRQTRLRLGSFSLSGFSISGLATYHLMPELNFVVDLGECPLAAIPLDNVFLTHAHGDHSRCLMRHHSLRKMTGISKDATYYMPEFLCEKAKAWIRAEAAFENVPEHKFRSPKIVGMKGGERLKLDRKDLALEAFEVKHSIPAMGCTLYRFKKKLLPEFLGKEASEIIELRAKGVEVTRDVYEPQISFMGDCKIESLRENIGVFDSEVVVTECTFVDDADAEMAGAKSHTHLNDIVKILEELGSSAKCKTLVLNHFSMKYSEKQILQNIEEKIPEGWKEKVKVLL